jgi:hypothetical protein
MFIYSLERVVTVSAANLETLHAIAGDGIQGCPTAGHCRRPPTKRDSGCVPPASKHAVMPVARNTWRPNLPFKPASAVRRWIMGSCDRRRNWFVGLPVSAPVLPTAERKRVLAVLPDPGCGEVLVEELLGHLVALATCLSQKS